MKVNDKIIYLTFIGIEKLLDKSKIEYQSLDNRIEFYANNDAQVIIDSDDTNITVFYMHNNHIFSLESDSAWVCKPNNIDLLSFIEKLANH